MADADLGEPEPARGEHNLGRTVVLDGVLADKPEFIALRGAIVGLPRGIREKLWAVAQAGRGEVSKRSWDDALAAAAPLPDDDIEANLLEEPDLHLHLRQGLYVLGAMTVPGDRCRDADQPVP